MSKDSNELELLEAGEEFFPRLIREINSAQKEIIIESYMLIADEVGAKIVTALQRAVQRGVKVSLILDSLGSADLSDDAIKEIRGSGIELHFFRPFQWSALGRFFFRRLHRKTIVIDANSAFVGGLNLAADYNARFPKIGKWDLAVFVRGPVAHDIHFHSAALRFWLRKNWRLWLKQSRRYFRELRRQFFKKRRIRPQCQYIIRDNFVIRKSIESFYLHAIHDARFEIIIANAYFVPSFRLIRALRGAARRGVRVKLLLQGKVEISIIKRAERFLYRTFMKAGVEIYEYDDAILHAKAGLIDSEWTCIGSSNLEAWSLSTNLEGNLVIHDQKFSHELKNVFERAISKSRAVNKRSVLNQNLFDRILNRISFVLVQFAGMLAKSSGE